MTSGSTVRDFAAGRISRGYITPAVLLLCAATLVVAYANKARCAGPPFRPSGRSAAFDAVKDVRVCYSDIQFLWLGRDINLHVFPYIHGGMSADGDLVGGVVEYPVLSGLLMWLGAHGAQTDAVFLLRSALLLAPFALLTAWLLARLSGWAALLWAAGPPLVLYAFHNWELPVVCSAVAAIYVMTALPRVPLRTRGVLAAVLLGIGCCFKFYPAIFVVPLMVYVFTGGRRRNRDGGNPLGGGDIRGAVTVGVAAAATVVVLNLPFALAGYDGWRASLEFQQQRRTDITTNSIWYWGLRPLFGMLGALDSFQGVVSVVSPVLVLAAFALAIRLGWRNYLAAGMFPWIAVSGSMLCGFLLFHKVHSPQYTLWLIPFLVVLEIPWSVVVSYLVADLAIGVGVFRYYYALGTGRWVEPMEAVVRFGVWGRATLLVLLFFLFLRVGLRGRTVRSAGAAPELAGAGART